MSRKNKFWFIFTILELILLFAILISLNRNTYVLIILLITLLFSPYTIYDFTKALFSIKSPKKTDKKLKGNPKVSVLYTCYNEFFPNSIRNAMKMTYKNYDIYVLDDSTDRKVKNDVDEFCKKHKIKVIRRTDRSGFKAGAINSAIKKINSEFFLILDSDSTLDRDFIQNALKEDAEDAGFIQGKIVNNNKKNKFAILLGDVVGFTFDLMKVPTRILFCGHNGLLKKSALEKIGGIPETTRCEDYAMTLKMYGKGFQGIYAEDAVSGEMFPSDYIKQKNRDINWAFGTTRISFYSVKNLIGSKLGFFDKLDIFLDVTKEYFLRNFYVVLMIMLFLYSIYLNIRISPISVFMLLLEELKPQMFVFYLKNKKIGRYIRFIFTDLSMIPTKMYGSLKAIFNIEKTFRVTKKTGKVGMLSSLIQVLPEISLGFILLCFIIFTNSLNIPIILFSLGLISTLYLIRY